jgi:hypothetical protein
MGGIVLVGAVVGAGMVAGFLRGGQLDGVSQAQVKLPVLLLAGFVLQALATLAGLVGGLAVVAPVLTMCALAALLLFALANVREVPGMTLIGLGVLCNLIVIGLNGGMPVTDGAWVRAGHEVVRPAERPDARHVLVDDTTVLRPLAAVLAVKPLGLVVSVGDIAQYAGVFLLVQGLMKRSEHARKPRYHEFDYTRQ